MLVTFWNADAHFPETKILGAAQIFVPVSISVTSACVLCECSWNIFGKLLECLWTAVGVFLSAIECCEGILEVLWGGVFNSKLCKVSVSCSSVVLRVG